MHTRMRLKPITAIIVLLLVVTPLLVAGCTASTPASSQNNGISVAATSLGSSNSLIGEFNLTENATPGNKFVTYAVYCENINAKDRQMGNPYWLKLCDTDGYVYSHDLNTGSAQQQVGGTMLKGLDGEMNTQPGDNYAGVIVFQIPTNATPKSLTYDDSSTYPDYPTRITINLSISTPPILTVLYFYGPTCPYCQALESTPSFHQLENTSKVTVTPIVSATSPLTDQYNVSYIPTLILLNHGAEVGRWVNATDASAINAQVSSLLKAG